MEWGSSSDEEKVARWKHLGELGIEEALRESGFPDTSFTAVGDLVHSGGDRTSSDLTNIVKFLNVDDAISVLLAILGRGASPIKILSLKKHRPQDALNEDEAVALCVNMISNTNFHSVNLRSQRIFGRARGGTLLGNVLISNSTLKELHLANMHMGVEAVKSLTDGLKENKTLRHIDLGMNDLLDEGVGYVAQMLKSNATLQGLQLHATCCGLAGAKHMSVALECNSTLASLSFGDNYITKAGMTILLKPLILDGDTSAGPKNTTLKSLHLSRVPPEHLSVESVASMLRTNKTLSDFLLDFAHSETRDWAEQIIPALKENRSLKSLNLRGSKGLTVEGVFEAFMDVVHLPHTGLENICISDTEMSIKEGILNEELRVNREYRSRLTNQGRVQPESGRLVLCGYEFAGKSSLCDAMMRIAQRSSPHSFFWNARMKCEKLLKDYPIVRQFLFGKNVYRELRYRTKGISIVVLRTNPRKISIWDFAGQREYYVLHDYLFPNDINSSFLYVCSVRLPPDDQNAGHGKIRDRDSMERDFRYWMRFIASNSKPVHDPDTSQRRLPNVTFVLTKKDTLDIGQQSILQQWAEDIVHEVKEEFENMITVSQIVDIVNAKDHNSEEMKRLLNTVDRKLCEILEQPTEYEVCKPIRHALATWGNENPSTPFLELDEFQDLCGKLLEQRVISSEAYERAQLNTTVGRRTVLQYLNSVGEIIFMKNLNFIVVNPKWFGVCVLGSLINVFRGVGVNYNRPAVQTGNGICGCLIPMEQKMLDVLVTHSHGFVRREKINHLLEKSLQTLNPNQPVASSRKLIDLMIKLELCFEEQPGNVKSRLFFPALFSNEDDASKGKRKLKWKLERSPHEYVFQYIGRRLECENKELTFLTPGFFPRLQVVLRNFWHEQKWTQNRGFEVTQNLLFFTTNGIEVFVEYSGDIDFFVDVLVKSSKPFEETLGFITENVLQKIRRFCSSPQGCQGVDLAEAVIRPECVEKLHVCERRKIHAVLVSDLKSNLQEYGESYKYTWRQGIQGLSDETFALDLLEGQGSYKRLIAACQVVIEPESSSKIASGTVTTHSSSQGIQDMQQLPKLFFPTIDDIGLIRKLSTKINLAEVMPIRLHVMCESRHGSHEVAGQSGRIMNLNMKSGGNNWPILKYAVSLLWVGVKMGSSLGGAPIYFLPLDHWIEELFSTPDMPIAADMLVRIMDRGRAPGPVPKDQILALLKRYMDIDPNTVFLQRTLNLQDSDRFFRDFKLFKVIYKDTSQIGWLCPNHYEEAIGHGTAQSVPH